MYFLDDETSGCASLDDEVSIVTSKDCNESQAKNPWNILVIILVCHHLFQFVTRDNHLLMCYIVHRHQYPVYRKTEELPQRLL